MKLRGVLQRDSSDCGAACLSFIAAYHGRHVGVSQIRQWASTDRNGTSVYGVLTAAEKLKMEAQAIRCHPSALDELIYPLIAHVEMESGVGHFVVLVNKNRSGALIMDPASGKVRHTPLSWFEERWTGIIITLVPATNFEKNKRTTVFKHLVEIARPYWFSLVVALTCAMAYTLIALSMSVYIQLIVDEVLSIHNHALLFYASSAMLVLLMLLYVTGYIKSRLVLNVSQRIELALIPGYIDHVLRLPKSFHDHMRSGEIISRLNDAARINMFVNDVLLHLVIDSLTLVLSLSLMFIYNWKLALVTALLLPVYIGLFWWNDKVNRRWQRKYLQAGAAFDGMVIQLLHNVSTVKQLALEQYVYQNARTLFKTALKIGRHIAGRQILIQSLMDLSTRLATVIVVWAGCLLIFSQELSAGEMISFISMMAYFSVPAMSMMSAGKQVRDTVISCDRLLEINDLEIESAEPGHSDEISGDIEFKNVSFRYGNGQRVLENVSLRIPEGSVTGLTGESGCGKTTLVSLLLRLYEPTQGEISIGMLNTHLLSKSTLRKTLTVVSQQTELFNTTVRENICLQESEQFDVERFKEAVERSGVWSFCKDLPHGLDTCVVEQGANFSGGQRQMIAIARALYRNTPYLILDEPTASMDSESEMAIMQTIEWCKNKGNTIIIISHSDTALKICDNIVVLKKQPSVPL